MWATIGALGIVAIEASYLPQIARLFQRKHADDISPFFPGLNLLGRVLAFLYAIHLGETVFIGGFMLGIVFRSTFLAQVLYYRNDRPWLRRVLGRRLRKPLGEAA